MKLYQLLNSDPEIINRVSEKIKERGERKDYIPLMRKIMNDLIKKYHPYINKIVINVKKNKDDYDVYGTITYPDFGYSKNKISIETMCWQKWLGAEVNTEDLRELGLYEFIEVVLYEMTFITYEDDVFYSKEKALEKIISVSDDEMEHYNLTQSDINNLVFYINER